VALGIVLAALVICAGMGWLYLLREIGALDAGPTLARALPLEQLARGDAQPLLRVACAWLPAGAAAGFALAWGTGWGRPARTAVLGVLTGLLLFGTGAVSDAVAVSESFTSKLGDQFVHEGIWVEVALVLIGSLLIPPTLAAPHADAATKATQR
jgi:hypothetical protein